jgi:hypothetical protein
MSGALVTQCSQAEVLHMIAPTQKLHFPHPKWMIHGALCLNRRQDDRLDGSQLGKASFMGSATCRKTIKFP